MAEIRATKTLNDEEITSEMVTVLSRQTFTFRSHIEVYYTMYVYICSSLLLADRRGMPA